MRFLKFGESQGPVVVLVHGAQVPWEVWEPQIERLGNRYSVVVAVLPGHDVSSEESFRSIERAAEEIESYLLDRSEGAAFAVCGQSLGGCVASVLWARGVVNIDRVLLEGAPLVPQPRLLTALMERQYLALLRKVKVRDGKTLRRAEKSFLPKRLMPAFVDMMEAMTEESVRNFVRSTGGFRLPSCAAGVTENVEYYYGTTLNEALSKRSARLLAERYPFVKLVRLEGYKHCEMSLFRSREFSDVLESFLGRKT